MKNISSLTEAQDFFLSNTSDTVFYTRADGESRECTSYFEVLYFNNLGIKPQTKFQSDIYIYPDGVSGISGFGGEYENICRRMVIGGTEWFDNNPNAKPEFSGYENIVGVIQANNEEANALEKYMMSVGGEDLTGAMMQFSINHVLAVHLIGWPKYCEELKSKHQS